MNDLYKQIAKDYNKSVRSDKVIKEIQKKIKAGKGTQSDVTKLSQLLGKHAADALHALPEAIGDGQLYYSTATETVKPLMQAVHVSVNKAAVLEKIQEDAQTGLGVNIVKGNDKAIDTLLNQLTEAKDLKGAIDTDVPTASQKFYDEFQKENLEIRAEMGYGEYVIRTYDEVGLHGKGEPCQYCKDREGTWEYPTETDEFGIWSRHPGCMCAIESHTRSQGTKAEANFSKKTNAEVMYNRREKQAFNEYIDKVQGATTSAERTKLWDEYEKKKDAYKARYGIKKK